MEFKLLENKEILDGLHLAWDVFAKDVAPTYEDRGIEMFRMYLRSDMIISLKRQGKLALYGAVEDGKVVGVGAVHSTGHIPFLMVDEEYRKRGIGAGIYKNLYLHAAKVFGVSNLTVNACVSSTGFFKAIGFEELGAERVSVGARFIPMASKVLSEDIDHSKRRKKYLVAGLVSGAIVCGILGIALLGNVSRVIYDKYGSEIEQALGGSLPSSDGSDNGGINRSEKPSVKDESAASASGIDSINCYNPAGVSYKWEDKTYKLSEKNGEYKIEFEIHYPEFSGLPSSIESQVNEMMKSCAMSTVETLYNNPTQAVKENMVVQKNPVIVSFVNYKVSYSGKNVLSVVFSDTYFAGDSSVGFADLRTRNVDLRDGSLFQTADIVNLDTDFMTSWLPRMKEESDDAQILSILKNSDMKKILNGIKVENNYYDNFFLDADGIQIGFTYHYNTDQLHYNGWITAPFSMEEMEKYRNDNDFWSLLD